MMGIGEIKSPGRTKTSIGHDGLQVRSGTPTASDPEWTADTKPRKATGNYLGVLIPLDIIMAENQNTTALSPGHPLSGGRVLRISRSAKICIHEKKLKIGTWNVRSMYQAGKTANIVQEMKRLQIDLLACSEVRWPGNGQCRVDEYQMYYAGSDLPQHPNGVAFIVGRRLQTAVMGFLPISDRIAIMKINSKPCPMNAIVCYAPTTESDEEDIELFYEDLKKALTNTKKNEITLILGDFNAKVGRGADESIVGEYGLGVRNERGERLVQFCKDIQFPIMNTQFQLPSRRLYTWKAPGDCKDKLIRNQIDYILVNNRFRNSITCAKAYPGADISSDHNLLLSTVRLRLKQLQRKKTKQRNDVAKLRNDDVRQMVQNDINEKMSNITEISQQTIEQQWNNLKEAIISTTNCNLLTDRHQKRNIWMTNEILQLMEERRMHKNRDEDLYRDLNMKIKKKIKEAKEKWLAQKCSEIEELEKKHDTMNLHKKVKEAAGIIKTTQKGNLTNDSGKVIWKVEDKIKEWEKYIKNLFADEQRIELAISNEDTFLPITKDETKKAIQRLKDGKSTGPDGIHGEILKLIQDEHLDPLVTFFNFIYNSGQIPKDWLVSTFVPIPKKCNAKSCGEYRTVSLMSHFLKVFLRIIHERIHTKVEEHIGNTQFGFRSGLGTRDALFGVQVLVQRARDVNCDVYACFIDFEKAFDRVKHNKLMSILENIGIDPAERRIIRNLYWHQKASIKVEDQVSEEIEIQQGVRQGCVLSPLLFNVYSEKMFDDAFEEINAGIMVNGVRINSLRYADDTVLLSDNAEGLQELIDRVINTGREYGLILNAKKTKTMIISKNKNVDAQFYAEDILLQRVENFNYLGCNLNEEWDHSREVKIRIEKARSSFYRMKKVLCNLSLNLQLRLRVLRCYVLSVLYYGAEAWTLTDNTTKRLGSFELWCYRRMLRISYMYHVTNDTVMQRMAKDREVLATIKQRKMCYFGHILRGNKYEMLQLIMQGKIAGKRGPGRRRTSWLKNLRQWTSLTSAELFRSAVNRVIWARMIVDIH